MADEGLREFIRDITRRNELVWQGVMAELAQGRAVLVGLQEEIADQRDQIRAQTQALLRLLDERFGPPPDED